MEAGRAYYDETVKGVQKGIDEAKASVAKRRTVPYTAGK